MFIFALAAAVGGTAVDLVSAAPPIGFLASLKSNMVGWAVGGAVAMAMPFAFKWLIGTGVKRLVGWELGRIRLMLNAQTGDVALDAFEKDLVLALAKLAKAKFPAAGVGLERRAWLIKLVTDHVSVLKGQEDHIGELIDQVVASQKEVLDSIK